jgi:Sec-independent protein translocase protein TatA
MFEEIKNKILEIGVGEENVEETFNLVTEEVLDNLFTQLSDISTDEELQVYAKRMEEAKSPEHLETIVNDIAVTVYGENALAELKDDYMRLLDGFKKSIDDAKALLERAQAGDPQAQELLKKVQQSDDFKNMVNQE